MVPTEEAMITFLSSRVIGRALSAAVPATAISVSPL
jgi:hypothetical protein